MNKIICDYHMHSDISPDSNAPMMEMCEQAFKIGLTEIAFTEHYEYMDLGKDNQKYSNPERIKCFENTLAKCIARYGDKLKIARAVELGSPHLEFGSSRALIKTMNYDYVLSSVHKLDSGDLTDIIFTKENHMELIANYYQHLLWLAQIGDYDCIAHLDMIKRHTTIQGVHDEHTYFWSEITQILDTIISRGRGLELNTSGLRQSPQDTMPSLDILKLYRERGGELITIGSDAHCPKDIAYGFDMAYEYLQTAGFNFYASFHHRKPVFHPL